MKILALSYLFPNKIYPNYGIFVLNRLLAVSRYHEVKVINAIPQFPGCQKFTRYRNYDSIATKEWFESIEVFHPRFFVIPKYLKSLDTVTYQWAVLPLAKQLYQYFPFDVIDIHWTYPDLPAGYRLARLTNTKFLVTLRGKEAFYFGEGPIREKIIKRYLSKADHVIGLSRELCETAISSGVPVEKTTVIRNGVDSSRFCYLEQVECRRRLGLEQDSTVILSIGSINYRKGFDRIIQVLPDLIKKYGALKLYILGDEGHDGVNVKGELWELVQRFGLNKSVVFRGRVDNRDLVYWYNAADIFCLASRGEGSPNVLSEALACGCPSLATNVGSVPEILSEKFMGEVVENKDEAILPGLLSMLGQKYDRKKIADHMKQYDWDWCARQVIKVYEKVLEK